MNALKNDPLGMRAIDTVKQSDAKEWAIRMSEKGYAYKTIDNYKRSLKASFYMAIQDDCIRKNPFEFKLSDVLSLAVLLVVELADCHFTADCVNTVVKVFFYLCFFFPQRYIITLSSRCFICRYKFPRTAKERTSRGLLKKDDSIL